MVEKYRKLSFREVQLIEKDLLFWLRDFCEENGLHFIICYGTLIGAARHKGFIPWDDDVDVCMARPDYEKLKKIAFGSGESKVFNGHYHFVDSDHGSLRPILRVCDMNTATKRGFQVEQFNGAELWVDIFPIDGVPSNALVRKLKANVRFFLDSLTRIAISKPNTGNGKAKTILKNIFRKPCLIIGPQRLQHAIRRLEMMNSYEKSNQVGFLDLKEHDYITMNKEDFENIIEIEFEGENVPTIECWDSFLTTCYGDYRKLPPEDQRTSHLMDAYEIKG